MNIDRIIAGPADFLAFRSKGLMKIGTDGASGTNEGVDRQVAVTAQHFCDAGRWHPHPGGEFTATDSRASHELEEFLHDDQLAELDLAFKR